MLATRKKQLWIPIAIAFLLSLIAIFTHPMGKIDRVWSDIVLTSEKNSVAQKYLIVEITAQDMGRFDGPPVPRGELAKSLTRLQDAGAKRILLDLTLSEELSSKEDLSLITAMRSFGPNRVAIPKSGASKFSAHATLVDLGLLTDPDGWTRGVQTSNINPGYNPATWLATGQLSTETVKVDLRYNPSTIERVSLGYVLEGQEMNFSDYNVIITPSNLVVPSRVQLPLSDAPDRAALVVLGSETLSTKYQTVVMKARWVSICIALIFMTIGVLFATFIQNSRLLFLGGLLMSFATVGLNIFTMKLWGGQGYPILQFICLLIGLFVTIAYKLRLFQMIASFLKGDLSPDEAWAWRAHEDSHFPVILLNAMGNIRRMNPAALQMKTSLGCGFDEKFQEGFRQGAGDISLIDPNGFLRRFTLEQPNSTVAIMVIKDVTEAARRLDTLQKTTNDLRKSQTQAIERAENYEQEKNYAEQASQQKSKFLANMSHELRTPLNAIIGFSEIMQREVFGPVGDPRYKEFTNNILFSGQHLLSLINDILDLSKIEAGKMKLKIEPVQANDLISQAISIVNVRAQDGHLKLIYENTSLPEINADSRAIKQILLNFLTNAIKFTPKDGIVRVTAKAQSTGLIIHVADSGIGISQEDIKRLAQPFEQVENRDIKNLEGTGLGLSLSKALIELHGGTFKMNSTLGKGTTVTFTIPNQPLANNTEAVNVSPTVSHPALYRAL